ncbi:hypothetical protein [Muricoccus vinaceus]|uniref:hypothetical protein n=1 Tax=Muricoccus vinaceus TaxID=424704 RepID=UPI00366C4655
MLGFVFVVFPVLLILAAAGVGGAAAFGWMLWSLLGVLGGEPGAWAAFAKALLLCAAAITVSATVFHYGFELLRRVGRNKRPIQPRPGLSITLRDAPFSP